MATHECSKCLQSTQKNAVKQPEGCVLATSLCASVVGGAHDWKVIQGLSYVMHILIIKNWMINTLNFLRDFSFTKMPIENSNKKKKKINNILIMLLIHI
jgi:hypothetical protein